MTNTNAPSPPPQAILAQMINGYWVTMSIHVAAKLKVADLLAEGPQSVDALASRTRTHAGALYRVLRALASTGIFRETEPRTFAQTPLSELLRSDVPGSMCGLAELTGIFHMRAWPEIMHSVTTGETAVKKVFGAEIFDYLATAPDVAKVFDDAFVGYTAMVSTVVSGAYDFSRFTRIVDVGGGSGALLATILARCPGARGVTFDLPHVAVRARDFIAKRGVGDRAESVAGDFFESVPAGGDAYTLKMILHDWDDAKSIAILKNVRRAIRPEGKLLVIEAVVPPGNTPSPSKFLDVNMLVMTGGCERTEEEYASLFAAAGFELTRVVSTPATSVVEGRPI
jgi:predicted O-methyltransferase YrrM